MDSGESIKECLMREIKEEAGLENLVIEDYLGFCEYYLEKKDAWITRHYFHLTLKGDCQITLQR